jgi:hypothetical protein
MEKSLSDVSLLSDLKEELMSSELVWAVWSDEVTGWEEKNGMEAPHPHLLSSIDRMRLEAYAQSQLNGFGVKRLQNMLGWERLRESWWPCSGSFWLGQMD